MAMFGMKNPSPKSAGILYWTVVSLIGAGLGVWLLVYTGTSVASTFLITATAFGGTSDLRSLFQTDQRGTASDAAARYWQARNGTQPAAHPAPTYFPRSGSEPGSGLPAQDPPVTGALPEPAATPNPQNKR